VSMVKGWANKIGAIAAWLLVCALASLIVIVGADFIQMFTINVLKDEAWTQINTVQAGYTITTTMNFYYVIVGVLWLGFFILMEHLLVTTGVPQKLVLRRAMFAFGIELLIVALLHLGLLLIQPYIMPLGFTVVQIPLATRIALVAGVALLGGGFIYFSRRKKNLVGFRGN
jgi:LPXTG-motif cell wall-anchored protein